VSTFIFALTGLLAFYMPLLNQSLIHLAVSKIVIKTSNSTLIGTVGLILKRSVISLSTRPEN